MMKETTQPCGICGKHRLGLFCDLPENEKEIINAKKTAQTYRRGDTLFLEGNPSFAIYCIHKGNVKLFKTAENGENQVVRILRAGDIIGFRAIISDEPYTATAEAISDTNVCVIPKDALFKLMDISKQFSREIISKLAVDLRQSEERILSFALHSVKKRCANFLLSLIEPHNYNAELDIIPILPLLKVEIAQIIGVSPETLSRILKQLSEQKIIHLTRKEISIIDLPHLEKIATT